MGSCTVIATDKIIKTFLLIIILLLWMRFLYGFHQLVHSLLDRIGYISLKTAWSLFSNAISSENRINMMWLFLQMLRE